MHSNSLGISFPLAHSAGFNSYFPAAADFPYLYKMRSNGNAEFYKYRLGCFYYPGDKVYWNTHSYITRDGRSFGICKTTGGTPGGTPGTTAGGGGGGGSTACPTTWGSSGESCLFAGNRSNIPCTALMRRRLTLNCDQFCEDQMRKCTGAWIRTRRGFGPSSINCEKRDAAVGINCRAARPAGATDRLVCECGCGA